MKLLIICCDKDLLKPGTVSFQRHQAYAEKLDELHIVVFARTKYGKERVQLAQNAWSYPTGSPSIVRLLTDAYRLGLSILEKDGDWVISTQDPFEAGLIGFLLRRATKVPLLLQEHGDVFSQPYWRRESILNLCRYILGRFLITRADHVRVVCKRSKMTLVKRGLASERITVAPVFVDTTHYRTAPPDTGIQALRPSDGVLLLTMARFVPQKNLHLMVRAFRLLLKSGVKARLVLVGDGAEKEGLLRATNDLMPDSVTFLDWTDDPAGALKAADIYVLSSDYEGWGRVCIEALAAGTPLVMTDVGCANEVVRHEESGLVVPVRDVVALAEALQRVATQRTLRTQLIQNGLEMTHDLGTKEDSIALYIEILTTCRSHAQRHRKV